MSEVDRITILADVSGAFTCEPTERGVYAYRSDETGGEWDIAAVYNDGYAFVVYSDGLEYPLSDFHAGLTDLEWCKV